MDEEDTKKLKNVGEMKKRRVKMEDGRRYLIYYTFENERNDELRIMNDE